MKEKRQGQVALPFLCTFQTVIVDFRNDRFRIVVTSKLFPIICFVKTKFFSEFRDPLFRVLFKMGDGNPILQIGWEDRDSHTGRSLVQIQ